MLLTLPKHEQYRKFVHLSSLCFPLLYLIWENQNGMLFLMGSITLMVLLSEVLRKTSNVFAKLYLRFFSASLRENEFQSITGAGSFMVGSTLSVALFSPAVSMLAMTILIICDTMAAWVGQLYGKHYWLEGKSIEGSLAFLLSGVLIVTLGSVYFALPIVPLLVGLGMAMLLEGLQKYFLFNDNILIPLGFSAFSTLLL